MSAEGTSSSPVTPPDTATLKEIFERPRKIASVPWSTVDAYETVLYANNIANALLSITYLQSTAGRYTAYRGNLNVRIDINGSPYHAGRAIAAWGCSGTSTLSEGLAPSPNSNIPLLSVSQYSTLPNVWINPSSVCSYSLQIPFRHIFGAARKIDTWEKLHVVVVNPLKYYGSAGLTDVQMNIYAWFTDFELLMPIAQSELSGNSAHVIPNVSRVVRGYASKFARGLADVALSSVGLGAPPVDPLPVGVFNKQLPSNKSDQPAHVLKLAGHQAFEDRLEADMESGDPMDFKSIYSKKAFLTRVAWTEISGPQLASFPVTPTLRAAGTYSVGSAVGGFQMLPMGMVSLPFRYWRGDIVFSFEVIAPKLVRGMLKVVYAPPSSSYTVGTDTADVHTMYVDISQSTEFEFAIPYSSTTPWLRSIITAHNLVDTDQYSTNGMLFLEVSEPLRASGQGIEINVFAHASRLEVAYFGRGPFIYHLGGSTYAVPQGEVAQDVFTNFRNLFKIPQVVRSYTMIGGTTGFACNKFSIRPRMKYKMLALNSAEEQVVYEYDAILSAVTQYTPVMSWVSAAFLGYRGGIRFGMVAAQKESRQVLKYATLDFAPTTMPTNSRIDAANYLSSIPKTGTFVWSDTTSDANVTVDTALHCPWNFNPTKYDTKVIRDEPTINFYMDIGCEDSTPENEIYLLTQCAGDDFSLDTFQFVPLLFTG